MLCVHYACKWRAGVMTISRKKTGRRMSRIWKSMVTCWLWRTRDESVVNNHSFVVGDEGKIIHVESIWGQFHVRKTKNNEMPRLSWSSSAAAQPRCSAYPHWMFLLKKVDYFFYNWSELRGKEKTFKNDFIFSLGRSIQFFHELKKNYVCIYSLFFSPF